MTLPSRVTLMIPSLGPGGAERVLSTMASFWAGTGLSVTLITLARSGADFYPLDGRVKRVGLDLLRPSHGTVDAVFSSLHRALAVRRAIDESQPEAVISFCDTTNILVLAALLGLPIPVVVAERNDPREQRLGFVRELLRRTLYRRAAAVVVQTEALRHWALEVTTPQAVHVVPNPVSRDPALTGGGAARDHTVVAIGRLSYQKGHDLLLRAFARIRPRHPEWRLCIVGEGAWRPKLESLASELGLADVVSLPSTVSPIGPLLRRAGVFVLPSRYEGFPNALLEAMATGTPVIAFDCPSGPAEIISHGRDGLIVPAGDVDSLAATLESLLADVQLRERLGRAAIGVLERYSPERVMAQWEQVLESALRESRGDGPR